MRSTPLHRKKALSSPRLTLAAVRGDIVLFRSGRDWLLGAIDGRTRRHAYVEEPGGRRHKVPLHPKHLREPTPDQEGAYQIALEQARHAAAMQAYQPTLGGALPPLSPPIVARTGGTPRRVPKPRRRYRDGEYLDAIRWMACIGCGAPPPGDPHHDGERGVSQTADDYDAVPLCRACHRLITDTYCLPGLSRVATEDVVQRTQNRCLKDWFALQRKLPREEADSALGSALTSGLPRLAAVAGAFLLVLLFSAAAWAEPVSAELLLDRGRVQLRIGKPKVAELLARRALAHRQHPAARSYLLLGDALAAQGRCDAARPEYLRAYEVAPGDPDVVAGIERCVGDLPVLDRAPAGPAPRPVAQGGRP